MRMKLRLLKQNLIVLNEWQSSRLKLPEIYCTCLGVNNCTVALCYIKIRNMTTNHTLVADCTCYIINYNIRVVALKIIFPQDAGAD